VKSDKSIARALIAALLTSLAFLPQANALDLKGLAKSPIRSSSSDESIYFVMVDRFENGDTSNDNAGFIAGDPTGGFDPTDPGYWHGGDIKGLTNRLSYIASMGFTSIWITPPVKQKYVQGSSAAYHGYWGLDFMTVDPHLGTETEFKEMVASAHKLGMKVIIDVVANHTADVIYYDEGVAKVLASEADVKRPAWLNKIENYYNEGNSEGYRGDFFGLDGIKTTNPEVIKGWIDIWTYWINEFDIDGFRIDTFKYVEPEVWKKIIPAVKAVASKKGKQDFPIFGEVYDGNPYATSSYVTSNQVESLLDFPFQKIVSRFATYGGNTSELATLFNRDDLYTTPKTNAHSLITFLGNHDMGRIGFFIKLGVLDNDLIGASERARLANALLFLLRGSPALYYGDEKGMVGTGGDKQARQDMFPTAIPAWQSQDRIGIPAIGSESSFDIAHPLQDQITELQRILKLNPALRKGTQQVRTTGGEVFAVTRFADNQEYFVAFNGSDEAATAEIKVSTLNSKWTNLTGACDVVAGKVIKVTLPARGYCLYKAEKNFTSPSKLSVEVTTKYRDYFARGVLTVSANVPGDGYNAVTFLYRTKGKSTWQTIGTAEKRTVKDLDNTKSGLYRTYLCNTQVKSGSDIELMAVVKSSSGQVAASKIIKAKVPQ
jgi:glycosidase